jgi:hypothetical protein
MPKIGVKSGGVTSQAQSNDFQSGQGGGATEIQPEWRPSFN